MWDDSEQNHSWEDFDGQDSYGPKTESNRVQSKKQSFTKINTHQICIIYKISTHSDYIIEVGHTGMARYI